MTWGFRRQYEPINYRESDFLGRATASVGIKQPAILRELRKQFLTYGNDLHRSETANEELKEWRRIRSMPYCRGYDKRHASPRPQQAGGYQQKWRPGCGQPGELSAKLGAKRASPCAHLATERLVANKWGITGGTIETLRSLCRPIKEIAGVDAARRRALFRHGGSLAVSFDADAVRVGSDKPAIATCRVEQEVTLRTDSPPNQAPHDMVRCVIGAGILSRNRSCRKQLRLWHNPPYPDRMAASRLRPRHLW